MSSSQTPCHGQDPAAIGVFPHLAEPDVSWCSCKIFRPGQTPGIGRKSRPAGQHQLPARLNEQCLDMVAAFTHCSQKQLPHFLLIEVLHGSGAAHRRGENVRDHGIDLQTKPGGKCRQLLAGVLECDIAILPNARHCGNPCGEHDQEGKHDYGNSGEGSGIVGNVLVY